MKKLLIAVLLTAICSVSLAVDLLSPTEFKNLHPESTAVDYNNYVTVANGGETSYISDDSQNTGVGSFNGDLSNSFNNIDGDSEITIDQTDTTTHSGGYNDTQTINQNTKTEQIIKSTPNVALTNLTTSGVDTCFGSATGGLSLAGIGISGGTTLIDENCVRLKNAKILSTLGLTDAAVALIALDPSVAKAISIAYPKLHARLVLGIDPEQETTIEDTVVEEKVGSSKDWKDNPNDLFNIIFKK